MSVGGDSLSDPPFATLDADATLELCGSLADYGEAGGLSHDLMLRVGRYAETRYSDNLDVLLAAARMYVFGGEPLRAKATLLRAGKLAPDDDRIERLMFHVEDALGKAEGAIRKVSETPPAQPAPSRPPGGGVPTLKIPAVTTRLPTVSPGSSQPPVRTGLHRFSSRPPVTMGPQAAPNPVVPVAPPEASEGRESRSQQPSEPSLEHARAVPPRRLQDSSVPSRGVPSSERPRPTRIRFLDRRKPSHILPPYELIGEIASGGMATVYLARLEGAGGFQRFVAIKRLHPHLAADSQYVDMFLDEGRIAAAIHDPHVVPILEVGTSGAGYFLVMEHIEGDTLAALVARSALAGHNVPPPVALRIAHDALLGLHAAHELTGPDGQRLGLVHRDCTPQNILVGLDGSARITDFGVARAAARLAITRPHQVKGKVGYLSPEQAQSREIDRRSDLFTMGIVLWETLTGRALFHTESDAETLSRVLSSPIPTIRSIVRDMPPAVDDVCRRALSRDPTRRFRTAAEMAETIDHAARSAFPTGMASGRELARYVRELIGADIAAQRESVRQWMAHPDGMPPQGRAPRAPSGMYRVVETPRTPSSRPPPREALHSDPKGLHDTDPCLSPFANEGEGSPEDPRVERKVSQPAPPLPEEDNANASPTTTTASERPPNELPVVGTPPPTQPSEAPPKSTDPRVTSEASPRGELTVLLERLKKRPSVAVSAFLVLIITAPFWLMALDESLIAARTRTASPTRFARSLTTPPLKRTAVTTKPHAAPVAESASADPSAALDAGTEK